MEERIEKLAAELKSKSTTTWAGGKEAFSAMPNAIEQTIRKHSAGIDSKLLQSYYEEAKAYLDNLVQQSDPYAETLRTASARLSELLERM
jgi:hypothetical protein